MTQAATSALRSRTFRCHCQRSSRGAISQRSEFLGRRAAHMRPGLGFRRVWTSAEAGALGPSLAEAIRGEFGAVFAVAREPAPGSACTGQLGASGTLSPARSRKPDGWAP